MAQPKHSHSNILCHEYPNTRKHKKNDLKSNPINMIEAYKEMEERISGTGDTREEIDQRKY